MNRSLDKYRKTYGHLWQTYGTFWTVRISYLLQFVSIIGRLIVIPIALSQIIARLSARDFDGATRATILYVGVSLAVGISLPLIKYIGMLGENRAYRTLTTHYFSRLITTDLSFFNSNLAGYLTTSTRHYVDGCMKLVRSVRDKYLSTVLRIVSPLVVIMWINVWLGLVTLGLTIVQGLYLLYASRAIDPFRTKSREIYKRNSGRMSDIISNILAIRAAAQEETYTAQVEHGASAENKAYAKRYIMQSKLIGIREIITVVFIAILLSLTIMLMKNDSIDLAAAILVVTYIATILAGIYFLSENLDEHDDLVDQILPAFDVLHRDNAVKDPASPVEIKKFRGEITFDTVSFAYEDSGPVLDRLSLTVPRGQKIGVVGVSGAGKSTLTKLLLRFSDVDNGSIMIDGIDIRQFRQSHLRRNIAYVPQEPLLLHTSIRDNILLARPDATDADIARALRVAHADHFVDQLPKGIDSIVGERGVKLSGGQKQRIAIARAVLQHAPIIVLDEATSALDSESEQIIKSSFTELLRGKTAIVVAHRLSTLSEMDRIIVVDNGRLTEDGTHDELLAQNGTYARLWRKQQRLLDE